jgi:uncharacterized cupredoxin-like copper-binding protein
MVGLRIAIGVIGLMVLVVTGCSSDDGDADAPADAQRLSVTVGDSFAYDPVVLHVQAGKPVVLTVRNAGNTEHDFTIMDMPATGVKNAAKGGKGHDGGHGSDTLIVGHPKVKDEVTIRFTPTRPGTYRFNCTLPGHQEQGMAGTIMVT